MLASLDDEGKIRQDSFLETKRKKKEEEEEVMYEPFCGSFNKLTHNNKYNNNNIIIFHPVFTDHCFCRQNRKFNRIKENKQKNQLQIEVVVEVFVSR